MTIGSPHAKTLAEVADANGSAMNLRSTASGQRLYHSSTTGTGRTTDPATGMATLTIALPDTVAGEASWFSLRSIQRADVPPITADRQAHATLSSVSLKIPDLYSH